MKNLAYRGFEGTIEYSEEDSCYFGKVLNINGLISYEGDTLEELEKDFSLAVDEHIDLVERLEINKKSTTATT